MNIKEKIINYLVSNGDSDGNIKISAIELGEILSCTRQSVSNMLKELVGEGKITRDGKTIKINKTKLMIDDLLDKRKLKYSNKEKELLYYIYNVYAKESYENGFEYVCITYNMMKQNTNIKKDTELNNYITKYIKDGILVKIDGDYKKRQSNKYKFIFDIDTDNNNQIENNIDNNNNEIIKLLMMSIDELTERMNNMAKYCLSLKQENEKINQRLSVLESKYNKPTEVCTTTENIVASNPHQDKETIPTDERIAVFNDFKKHKAQVIQYINEKMTDLEHKDTLDDILERVNKYHDLSSLFNQLGYDIDGVFYILTKLSDSDGNILVYRYLSDRVFLQRMKTIISNIN